MFVFPEAVLKTLGSWFDFVCHLAGCLLKFAQINHAIESDGKRGTPERKLLLAVAVGCFWGLEAAVPHPPQQKKLQGSRASCFCRCVHVFFVGICVVPKVGLDSSAVCCPFSLFHRAGCCFEEHFHNFRRCAIQLGSLLEFLLSLCILKRNASVCFSYVINPWRRSINDRKTRTPGS